MATSICDVFESDDVGYCNESRFVEENSWKKLKNSRFKEGFVDGKSSGEEKTLQSGFDQGYVEGFELSFPLSIVKGILAVNKIRVNDEIMQTKLQEAHKSIEEFENRVNALTKNSLTKTFHHNEPNDDIVSNNMLCDDDVNLNQSKKNQIDQKLKESSDLDLSVVNDNSLKELMVQFNEIKNGIALFFKEFDQPVLSGQISAALSRCQKLLESRFCTSEDHNKCQLNSTLEKVEK